MRRLRVVFWALVVAGCATTQTEGSSSKTPSGPPTEEEARQFFNQVDADLRRLWVARDRAGWVNETFITDDTEQLAAAGEEATAEYLGRKIPEATRFDSLSLPPDLARMRYLLKISQTIPAPSDAALRGELAGIETWMTSTYGKGKYCPSRLNGKCLTLDDIEDIMAKSRDVSELTDVWKGWHAVSVPMRPKYARYVKLANLGAQQIGFSDVGAMWRSAYDMSPEAFEAEEQRLWEQVKPLYQSLHCYARKRLRQKYGDVVPAHGPIPAQLLGNMWAQDWKNVYDLLEPYAGEPSLDVGKKLVELKKTPQDMVHLGENFFVSLGFHPLPQSFWERSLFVRPPDREVVCHASAWDVDWHGDLRVKMCIEPKEEDLVTIHHELGHDFYFQSYDTNQPILFEQGANAGFHEAIGDTIALSVTPSYLKRVGLLDSVSDDPKAKINHQMRMALDKVAFLPFGLLIDKWRWDVFNGKVSEDAYNQAWWKLRAEYQGVVPPVARSEADFDPGAKFHVASSTPYAIYFLADIYEFQFHRALCKIAGYQGPLDECSIYGNAAAGEKLRAMLALGASKPWPEALKALDGETQADASAILEYFKPLKTFLDEQTQGEQCGW